MAEGKRATPFSENPFLAQAKAAAASGDYARVLELYTAAADAGRIASHERAWGLLLIEAGAVAEGQRLCASEPLLPNPASGAETGYAAGDDEDDDFLVFDAAPRTSAEAQTKTPPELVANFARWFSGRGDIYARQWYDARNDRTGYVPVREPLDERVVQQHLEGRLTLGQYLLYPDHHVSFAVLDLDPTSAAWEHVRVENMADLGGLAVPALADYARRIVQAAADLQIPAFLEDTGGSGLHVWVFFAPRVPARRARAFLRELLWRSGSQPATVVVEIFPKQDTLTGKGLGNLVKLPLGIHQATLRPSRFLDRNLEPLSAADALNALRAVDPLVFEQVLQQRVVPLRPTDNLNPPAPPPPAATTPPLGSPRALAEALASIPSGEPVKQAVDRILEGCAVLQELARRGLEGEPLSATALRCLVYSIGLVGRENPIIDQLLARASASRKELERVRRGLQSPVGCKRLHEYFPELASRCHCPEVPEAGYATPALFAFSTPPRFSRREPISPVESEDWIESTLPDTKEELQAIIARLERMEKILHELFPKLQERPFAHDRDKPPWE